MNNNNNNNNQCEYCKKVVEKVMVCSRCKTICYCSKECQKNHWKEHKGTCTKILNSKKQNSKNHDNNNKKTIKKKEEKKEENDVLKNEVFNVLKEIDETEKRKKNLEKNSNEPHCENCYKTEKEMYPKRKLNKCSKCKKVLYCSTVCQQAHWSKHKYECGKVDEKPYIPPDNDDDDDKGNVIRPRTKPKPIDLSEDQGLFGAGGRGGFGGLGMGFGGLDGMGMGTMLSPTAGRRRDGPMIGGRNPFSQPNFGGNDNDNGDSSSSLDDIVRGFSQFPNSPTNRETTTPNNQTNMFVDMEREQLEKAMIEKAIKESLKDQENKTKGGAGDDEKKEEKESTENNSESTSGNRVLSGGQGVFDFGDRGRRQPPGLGGGGGGEGLEQLLGMIMRGNMGGGMGGRGGMGGHGMMGGQTTMREPQLTPEEIERKKEEERRRKEEEKKKQEEELDKEQQKMIEYYKMMEEKKKEEANSPREQIQVVDEAFMVDDNDDNLEYEIEEDDYDFEDPDNDDDIVDNDINDDDIDDVNTDDDITDEDED